MRQDLRDRVGEVREEFPKLGQVTGAFPAFGYYFWLVGRLGEGIIAREMVIR